MKKIALFIFVTFNLFSQAEYKYRRSSLSLFLIESESFDNKDAVLNSYSNYPFPDKYDNNNFAENTINLNFELPNEFLKSNGYLDTLSKAGDLLKASTNLNYKLEYFDNNTKAVVFPSESEEFKLKLDYLIKEKNLGNQLVNFWYQLKDNKYSENLISERGLYDASVLDASLAQNTERKNAILSDAGFELLDKSFIVFTKLNFYSNEPVAAIARDKAIREFEEKSGNLPGLLKKKGLAEIQKAYDAAKEGYTLISKNFLYKLNYSPKQDEFFASYYNDPSSLPNDFFNLEFIDHQYNSSLVTFSLKEKRTQEQLIDIALVRNLDNMFAKLQRKNEVFKPLSPLLSLDPIVSQIGLKEGVEKGDKFEVLEQGLDENSKTFYKKIGEVSVGDFIWDNRYNATDELKFVDEDGKQAPNGIKGTVFDGGKTKYYPGLLLKLKK